MKDEDPSAFTFGNIGQRPISLPARLDRVVDDSYLVAGVPGGRRALGEQAARAVLVAHANLILLGLVRVLLDLMAGDGAADGAEHGRDLIAAAAADLVADDAAEYAARDRAAALGFTILFHLADFLDHRAFAARGSRDRRQRDDRRRRLGPGNLQRRLGRSDCLVLRLRGAPGRRRL